MAFSNTYAHLLHKCQVLHFQTFLSICLKIYSVCLIHVVYEFELWEAQHSRDPQVILFTFSLTFGNSCITALTMNYVVHASVCLCCVGRQYWTRAGNLGADSGCHCINGVRNGQFCWTLSTLYRLLIDAVLLTYYRGIVDLKFTVDNKTLISTWSAVAPFSAA